MKSQGYKSAQEQYWNKPAIDGSVEATIQPADAATRQEIRNRWETWISHKSHRGQCIAVDHVFYSNPSDQKRRKQLIGGSNRSPDWTRLVFDEIRERILEQFGVNRMYEVFAIFDTDGSGFIERHEFDKVKMQYDL